MQFDNDKIYIIDDLVSLDHANYLGTFYTSPTIDWRFQKDITFHPSTEKFYETNSFNYGFANLMFSLGEHSTPMYHTAAPIMYAACERLGIKPRQVLRSRAFIQMPIAGQTNEVNNPHKDSLLDHIVILYYVTDADGETIIYNETEESDSYTIKETISPKKGRCVVFNGKYMHNSSKPTNNIRCIINTNIIV